MRVILLSPDEVEDLHDEIARAHRECRSVRVADDEGSFKVKIGHGSWSPPLGVVEVDD